eukprot:scaffold213239_cov17-Prasinocladus_malaysianus.AAC.1
MDDGVLSTTMPHENRYHYDFLLGADGRLTVSELDKKLGVAIELLPAVVPHEDCGWAAELPKRLIELCSHWVSRPVEFNHRQAQFLLHVPPGPVCASAVSRCVKVPAHLQNCNWLLELLPDLNGTGKTVGQLADLLVVHQSEIQSVLSKIERVELIHTFTRCERVLNQPLRQDDNSNCALLLELPRFGLEFLLGRDGQLQSLQHTGYDLAMCQQLVWSPNGVRDEAESSTSLAYTLPSFTQYIILERQTSEHQPGSAARRVLIPAGPVVRGASTGQ